MKTASRMKSAPAIECSMAVPMLLIDIRHGARTISLASRRNRLDTEAFRRLAALPRVDHRRICRLDVAGQARGIEQRMAGPALGQPLAQRAEQRRVAGKVQGKGLLFLKTVGDQLRQA